jgi:hypothetical protein
MVNPGDRWAAALIYMRVHGVEKSESLSSRIYWERARVGVVLGHAGFRKGRKARGRGGGKILEKPRPVRHWPPTEPRDPLLGQSRRELITAVVLLSAFRLLKTLRFRALYQRGVCMYIYVGDYIADVSLPLVSTGFDHLLFRDRENFSTHTSLVPRGMLKIVRLSVSRRSCLILVVDISAELLTLRTVTRRFGWTNLFESKRSKTEYIANYCRSWTSYPSRCSILDVSIATDVAKIYLSHISKKKIFRKSCKISKLQ